MSTPRLLLGTVATMLGAFGCDRYEAPCTVGEPETLLSLPSFDFEMRRLSEDRVLLLRIEAESDRVFEGWAKETQDVNVDAVLIDKDGTASPQHQVMRDVPLSELSWPQLRDRAWLGDSLAALSTQVENTVDSQGVPHTARQLQLSIHDEQGLRAGPIALVAAACTDCTSLATVRGVGDEALVVFAQQANGQTDWHTSWFAVGSDGQVRDSGTVGDLAADETVELLWFAASPREDALFIPTTGNRAWLADNRFRRLTAPIAWQRDDEWNWDWDLARARIARAWAAGSPTPGDILTELVGFDSQVLLAEDRISAGAGTDAIALAPSSVGVILARDGKRWFTARGSDGAKLGGDVLLDFQWGSSMLVPTGANSFRLYGAELPDGDGYVLRTRSVECRP